MEASSALGRTLKNQRLPVYLAAVGVLLCGWLWVIHARTFLNPGGESFCSVGAKFDCVQVAASRYAVFLGVPWAAYGLVGFIALAFLSWRRSILALGLGLAMSAGSLALLGIELFAIGSVCLYCEATHVLAWLVTLSLFVTRRSLLRDERSPLTLQLGVVLPLSALLTLSLFLPRYWGTMTYKAPPPFPTGITAEGLPWIGSANPRVTIHEFTDYRCPHCKIASAQTLRALARASGVRVVRRQQPRMHCTAKGACESVRFAFCALDQGKFWQADRYLFEMSEPRKDLDIDRAIEELNLDSARLHECIESPGTWARAEAEADHAFKSKITGTPGYMVDGKRISQAKALKLF
jgi:uncharacterized membrane protein